MIAAEVYIIEVMTSRRIVAVSGGVDSVVLLHQLAKKYPSQSLVVAHVDHGIRPGSASDADFVAQLARDYGCDFRKRTLKLGQEASELQAREARYQFLKQLAQEYQGLIYTAHHADDIVESMAINLTRGTGWRGMAVMGAAGIVRPLTHYFKTELLQYAKDHQLSWREDSTNQTDKYLRNRLRQQLADFSVDKKLQLLAIWSRQQQLAEAIDSQAEQLATDRRYFYIMSPPAAGLEVLRSFLGVQGVSLTRPQLERTLMDIKTKKPGAQVDLAAGNTMKIAKATVHINTNQ